MSEKSVRAFVDRFEGDAAVLLVGDEEHEIDVPKSLLPSEAKEGSWLIIRIQRDEAETRDAEERIARLTEKLGQ